jgi:hypothetical protein
MTKWKRLNLGRRKTHKAEVDMGKLHHRVAMLHHKIAIKRIGANYSLYGIRHNEYTCMDCVFMNECDEGFNYLNTAGHCTLNKFRDGNNDSQQRTI